MTGKRFGMLTVVSYSRRSPSNGKFLWNCRCECGVEKEIEGGLLRDGSSANCGCVFKNKRRSRLIGHRFSKLVVVSFSHSSGGVLHWMCKCDCGGEKVVSGGSLSSGMTKSCGCLAVGGRHTHGMSGSQMYKAWAAMKDRCQNKNNTHYSDYGGRGISVCERWSESFQAFADDMGQRPAGMTIERIDNNAGYCKENCKWATRKEQQNNRRANRMVEINGETRTFAQWCEHYRIRRSTASKRIDNGYSDVVAITTPTSVWLRKIKNA